MTDSYFEIRDGSNFIKVDVIKQNFPDANLDWDKNSVNCWVSAKFGMFSGKFNTDLMTTDFEIFKKELEILYENLDRSAIFEGYEDQVAIRIKGDGIGHLNVLCWLNDYVGIGNELKGELNFDQTELKKLIGQLGKITTEYKVYGKIKKGDTSLSNSLWQRIKNKFAL
nr:hypothetical protein [Allomuricauda sp.]